MATKIIHQIVFGKVRNPIVQKSLKSWEIMRAYGFEIRIWDFKMVYELIFHHYKFALTAFETARNLGEASDICRYLIVEHHGGYYIDWDIELTDVNMFIELDDKFQNGILLIDPKNESISCEFFSASKNDLFLKTIALDIVETFINHERDGLTTPQYSGPYRVQQSFHKFTGHQQLVIPIKDVFEYDYWEIRHAQENSIKTKMMIHYWLHTWNSFC